MKSLAGGAVAAALLLSAMSAAAEPAPPTPAIQSQEAQLAAIQSWLAETAAWTQGYDALTTRQVDTLMWLLTGAETLIAKLETGSPAAAREWVRTWEAEARSKLAADMNVYTGLSTQAPEPPRGIPLTAEVRARMEVIGQTSDQVGTMMLAVNQASDDYIRVMVAAASGRQEDLVRIDAARLGLLAAQLEAEITMIQSASAALTGPNLHFARSNTASNRALIVWLAHNKLVFAGQPADSPAAAGKIRAHAAEMRREVDGMRREIDVFAAQIEAEPGFSDTQLGGLFRQLLASFATSADVELRLATAIDELADAVASTDETADDAVALKIEVLATERLAIDQRRRALMAQSGG